METSKFAGGPLGEVQDCDLHVGVVQHEALNDGRKFVALFFSNAGAPDTEKKQGVLLSNWIEVTKLIDGIIEQSTLAFGEPVEH